jgi:PPOX class probable F420-dependent enzyme
MRLTQTEAWSRVAGARHGVLGTAHRTRGVDLIPVVYAIDDVGHAFMPVDTIKAKSTLRLQRLENLRDEPRSTLLVEHYDDDWSQLWWVRVNGVAAEATKAEVDRFTPLLARRYRLYREPGAVATGIVLLPTSVVGWQAQAT